MALTREHLAKLGDKLWRLNNLYWITDKRGKKVRFRMTPEQLAYYEGMHTRNLILKARQLGFTTEQCIIQLDAALFESAKCALIAHTLNDAKRLFREKIQYAYKHLPAEIRQANPASNDAAGELVFSKGGSLYISTSFRGGTLRYLHVSEFGKICAKYPEKAREIVTGAFEAVADDCYVTIESTAEGRAGSFYDYAQQAEKQALSRSPLGPLDWKFFFFSWWMNPAYSLESDRPIPQRLVDYFATLEQKHGIKLSEGQKAWYHAKERTLGDDMKREYPSIPAEAFQQSVEGAYYAKQFAKLYSQQRIGELPDNSHQPVSTYWDLGIGDSTAIWFVRRVGEEHHIIDYYENSGEGLRHYMKVLKDRGYTYAEHWAPHDIDNRELGGDGKTRRQLAREGYEVDGHKYTINFNVVPKIGVDEGIEAVREILPRCAFDAAKAEQGVLCLESYRKEWDDKRGCWKDKPLHDWSSHGCLVAGTLVETAEGDKPVEQVFAGDQVALGSGVYGRVTHSGLVKQSETLVITLSNGAVIECSPEHKIFTNRGVLVADALRYNDAVSTREHPLWNIKKFISVGVRAGVIAFTKATSSGSGKSANCLSRKKEASSECFTASCTSAATGQSEESSRYSLSTVIGRISRLATGILGRATLDESSRSSMPSKTSMASGSTTSLTATLSAHGSLAGTLCTAMYGLITTAPSLKGSIFTTSITTKPTIALKTWSLSLLQIIQSIMPSAMLGLGVKRIKPSYERPPSKPRNGTGQPKAVNGIASTVSALGIIASSMREIATNAVSVIRRLIRPVANSAQTTAVRVVSVEKSAKLKPVYDLTVEHHHAYHANGVLVSNSDAFRYFAVANNRKPKPRAGMRRIGGLV